MECVNVEIKAACRDAGPIRQVLRRCGADFRGTDHQLDTYFRVGAGRLKLREGRIENHLIHYDRPNEAAPKRADVLLLPAEPGSPIKEILTRALGVLVVVEKRREIYFVGNVKVHLDEVAGLGRFVEIEAQSATGDRPEEELLAQCREYLELLGIAREDLLAESYSDLLLRSRRGGSDASAGADGGEDVGAG